MTGASGFGTAIRNSPMMTIATGFGNVNTTPAVIVTIEIGRPQPSSRIGPATYWPSFAGNTVATAASTRSARAMRSSRDQDVVGVAVADERAQRRRVDRRG